MRVVTGAGNSAQSSRSFKVRLCELRFAQAICYVHSIIINFIPGILEAKKMIQKYKGDTK